MTIPYPVTRAIAFEGYRVPVGFESDRCTDAPDHLWDGIDLRPACAMHDFQRRYRIGSPASADARLYRFLRYLGAPRWTAFTYWVGVVVARRVYYEWHYHTLALPPKWAEYGSCDKSIPNMPVPS